VRRIGEGDRVLILQVGDEKISKTPLSIAYDWSSMELGPFHLERIKEADYLLGLLSDALKAKKDVVDNSGKFTQGQKDVYKKATSIFLKTLDALPAGDVAYPGSSKMDENGNHGPHLLENLGNGRFALYLATDTIGINGRLNYQIIFSPGKTGVTNVEVWEKHVSSQKKQLNIK
jgi:hypothetical protein